jgi:hypothetical protein
MVVLTGKEFKEQYGIKFYKFLAKDFIHNGFNYKIGLNVDTKKFHPSGQCNEGGLYFTDKKNILSFSEYGPNLGVIEIPDDAQVYIEENKFKADKLELTNILLDDDTLEIIKYAHENGCQLNNYICNNAAYNGHLEVLKYAHKNGYQWNKYTYSNASLNGHLEVLKWLHSLSSKEDIEDKPQTLSSPLVTIEFAGLHKNNCPWNEWTCANAALNGHLEVLEWLHKNGWPWDEETCSSAALNGHFEVLKYLHDNGCPWDTYICASAALNGHLEILKWARENGCPWDASTCSNAAKKGHLNVLKYARVGGCPWDSMVCYYAALNGNLEMLKYAHENGCPFDEYTSTNAASNGHLEVLKYVHENGC